MLRNFFKTAIRNLVRHKAFSFINIIGLSIGLAAFIMIAMWVFDELSYDRFHENADSIYRVERNITYEGQTFFVPVTGAIYGPTIRQDYPEVVNMVRIDPMSLSVEGPDKTRFNEMLLYVDTSFFQMFTFPLKVGDPKTALTEPRSLVLSDIAAKRFFGDEDAMNKTLRIDFDGEMVPYKVTGILEKLPSNKHFDFEILASFSTLEDIFSEERLNTWLSNYLYTYVQLNTGTDKKEVETKLDGLVEEKILPAYMAYSQTKEDTENSIHLFLRPLTSIHLKSGLMWDIEVQGDIKTVFIFSIVALLILLIAAFNFMSLSTAQSGSRALEVGIRKTVGSSKQLLVGQFVGESILTALLAFIIALGLINIFLPAFNDLTGKSLSMYMFLEPGKLLVLLLIVTGTGFLSGIYPAFYMSAVKPIKVLKGRLQTGGGKFSFRQVLVVIQFSISIALIIGTFTALRQMNFMQNKPMGYNKENIMVLPVESNDVITHFESFKADLLKNPLIINVAGSQKVPAEREYSDSGWETDLKNEMFLSRFFAVDFGFIETYELEMAAGRPFDEKLSTDKHFKVIINETAAKKLGYVSPEEAIGGKWNSEWVSERIDSNSVGKVIGVVKDFHFQSLKNKIEPLTLFIYDDWINRISIRYADGKEKEAIAFVEQIWKDHFPDVQYHYEFINDYLRTFYKAEAKLQTILLVFTILAIFIASLGLFGLAIYIARQKIKEIGVRKAMGASEGSIVLMLSKTFTRWVILANLIAWPVAWYFMNEWLSSFSYRIQLNVWTFLIAGLAALFIALITISYRSWMAAKRNPVEALRYE
jgi:putative ABC transport system permease protein